MAQGYTRLGCMRASLAQVKEGDVVLALKSSGVHSNGFSLVRKVLEVTGTKLTDPAPWEAGGKSIGEVGPCAPPENAERGALEKQMQPRCWHQECWCTLCSLVQCDAHVRPEQLQAKLSNGWCRGAAGVALTDIEC
eukprot:1155397-Pelagomonas_calceolata.AAC.6